MKNISLHTTFMRILFNSAILLASLSLLLNNASAQTKLNIGISMPNYLKAGRFDEYLDLHNELQKRTGDDALKLSALHSGFGLFAEFEFRNKWSFDIYYNKYSSTTNYGKTNIDSFTKGGTATSQYKVSHGVIGVGVSRKLFSIMNQGIWGFTALSGGTRKSQWRPEGGSFSRDRETNNRLFTAQVERPAFFNIGLAPRFTIADKFFISPKIGYEVEILKGDANTFHAGLPNLIQYTYSNTGTTSIDDAGAMISARGDYHKEMMKRFFVDIKFAIRLGKPY